MIRRVRALYFRCGVQLRCTKRMEQRIRLHFIAVALVDYLVASTRSFLAENRELPCICCGYSAFGLRFICGAFNFKLNHRVCACCVAQLW